MIKYVMNFCGFTFANFILEDPVLVKSCSQIHFVSYNNLDVKGFHKSIQKTPIISLNNDIDSIFKKFSKTTRNEINKTLSNEKLHFECDSSKFDEFYSLYVNFERKKKRSFKLRSLDMLKKGSKLFLAFYEGELIAGILCYDTELILRANIICSKRMNSEDKEYLKTISNASTCSAVPLPMCSTPASRSKTTASPRSTTR